MTTAEGGDVPTTVQNAAFSYCFLQAQNWVGVDVVPPDCSADPTSILCTDPDAGNCILYSNCFLSVMWWHINSPYLPDTDQSNDLISQFQDIADICNVTMLPSLIRAPPDNPVAPSPTYLLPGTDPNENSTATADGVCIGQIIAAGATKRDRKQLAGSETQLLGLEDNHSPPARVKRASARFCDRLSQTYGTTTGNLQTITGADNCSFTASPICVPPKCSLTQVASDQT
ncbi:MAG: hypothetical protein Q9219_006967, partial [cf. Caloplaca sp. 3 TL-2023]